MMISAADHHLMLNTKLFSRYYIDEVKSMLFVSGSTAPIIARLAL